MTPVPASVIDARAADRTVLSMFQEALAVKPRGVALRWKDGDGWGELTWTDYAEQAARVAGGLRAAGIRPGDRVVLMMRNRPEFHIADLGALIAGATPISIYNSSSPEQVAYLVGHARARAAILEDTAFLARVQEARPELPALEHLYLLDGEATDDVRPWSDLLAAEPLDIQAAADACDPSSLATVIYTSGTTGPPKGVQITHRNAVWTTESALELVGDIRDLRTLSYLPMAHIAERMVSHYLGIACTFEVTTCPDASAIAAYCREVQPQLLFGVPRVWEKMQAAVRAALAADPDKAKSFQEGITAALPLQLARRTRELTPDERSTLDFLDEVAFRPVRELLGFNQLVFAVSSAAPIAVETLEWFVALGVPFSELYGMSENTGPLTWEPCAVRPGTVGRPIPGVELRLAEDGEIVARGGLIFPGYLDDPEQTAQVLDADGWLHTGDIGELDDDGYLRIVDRKKELIITAGGKNISPANLESALRTIPLVGQAAAIGDQRRFVSALLVLDPDTARAWAAAHGRPNASLAELAEDPEVLAEVERGVEDVMADFNHAEQVKRFTLLSREWLPDSEELTPTAKLKRRGIHAKYADEIEAMYRS